MKLSELTYEYLQSVGLSRAHIHTDCSDALRELCNQEQFERAKEDLMAAYGDVTIEVDPKAEWFNRIKIVDGKWQADYDNFCREKAAWCRQNTAE